MLKRSLLAVIGIGIILLAHSPVTAASITPVSSDDTGALTLAQAMVDDPSTLHSARFVTVPPFGSPHGLTDGLSFFPTQGDAAAILTSGAVTIANDANTSSSSGADIGGDNVPGRGSTAYDVSILELTLVAPSGVNCLFFDFALYSEEYPEYVGSAFNDAFIAELDNSTWFADFSISAPDNFAFDPEGDVISINSTGATSMSELNASGTTYDGATVLLEAATQVDPGTHQLYFSIFDQGDHIFDSAVFIDNVRFQAVANPTDDCQPGAQPKTNVPLIFLPGIGGSQMLNNEGEVWPRTTDLATDTDDDFVLPLRLAPNGVDPYDANDPAYTTVHIGDILREESVTIGPIGVHTEDVYQSTITTLVEEADYQEGEDLFPWPYDWRRGIPTLADELIDYIDQVRTQTGAEQVDILAHSMGGLIARVALADQASVGKVRRVITLGTPVLGAPKILGVLQYKTPCWLDHPILGCLSNADTLQEVLENLPSTYHIMPGPAFHTADRSPVLMDRDTDGDGNDEGEQSYNQWTAMVSADHNAGLMATNRSFHNSYDDLTLADPSVQFYRVVGSGIDTVVQIREYENCFLWLFNCEVAYEAVKDDGNGDGAVPLHSADLYNPDSGFDYRNGRPNAYAHGREHGDLPIDDAVLDFVIAFFGSTAGPQTNSTLLSSFSESMDARTASALAALPNAETPFGLDDTPAPFSGTELETLGPVQVVITDGADGYLGVRRGDPPTAINNTLPGGSYDAIGDTQALFLNNDGLYEAHMEATQAGPIRLRVRSYSESQLNGQTVFNVNASIGAQMTLSLDTEQALTDLVLTIDLDGDGTPDISQEPDSVVVGPEADDVDPPQTTLEMHLGEGQTCDITFEATDQPDGSGVANTYYILDGGQMMTYEGTFSVTCGTLIRFLSVDAAGNSESVQTVQTVPLDIKPGSDPNSINLKSKGTVPLAILATATFDPTMVDASTVALASAPVAVRGGRLMTSFEDVNGDGMTDLVLHVPTGELQLDETSVEAFVTGFTEVSVTILGVDSVSIVP